MEWLTSITYWLIAAPVLLFWLTIVYGKIRRKRPKRVNKAACDLATLFLLLTIPLFVHLLFNKSFVLYFILGLLLLGVAITFFYAKKEGEIHYRKLFFFYWRILFLLLSGSYVILFCIGMGWSVYLFF